MSIDKAKREYKELEDLTNQLGKKKNKWTSSKKIKLRKSILTKRTTGEPLNQEELDYLDAEAKLDFMHPITREEYNERCEDPEKKAKALKKIKLMLEIRALRAEENV